MTLGLTQPLTEMSSRNIPWGRGGGGGGKGGRCVGLKKYHLNVSIVFKSGILSLLETPGLSRLVIFSIYLSDIFNSCHCLLETKRHSCLFLHWSGSKFLAIIAACTPSIHIFLGRPLFLLSCGILLMWPYLCSLFFSMMSMMSSFPFTPIFYTFCSYPTVRCRYMCDVSPCRFYGF